ncbi:MAG: ribonuclease PH [Rhodospirillales bacterium]|nr:ribonuclease PH [Rhodospirillales bacterium]
MRASGRAADQLRPVVLEADFSKYAEGSCLARFGDTHVLCAATVEQRVPAWLRDSGRGWVTAEYGMLPRATNTRTDREAARGRQTGRTQEIQRLIGRSLRAVTDLAAMNEMMIKIDCDVLQADGGTRTAAVTGAYVALHRAFERLVTLGLLDTVPLTDQVAAVSCGIVKDSLVLDLDYEEDSTAQADTNFVLTATGGIVEIQGTAEDTPFSEAQFMELVALARKGIGELTALQRTVLGLG